MPWLLNKNPIFHHSDLDKNIKFTFSIPNGKLTCKMYIAFLKEISDPRYSHYLGVLSTQAVLELFQKVTHYGTMFLNGVRFYDGRFKQLGHGFANLPTNCVNNIFPLRMIFYISTCVF